MSQSIAQTPAPIYIWASMYHENHTLYSAHPTNVEENIHRLRESHVDPARVHLLTDTSYLLRAISSRGKKAVILGGGYTPFLSRELEPVKKKAQEATIEGTLDIWGQCAGANMLCDSVVIPWEKKTRNFQEIKPLGLLPITADAGVYPIETSASLGDLINRRIVTLDSASDGEFSTYWYRGSKFRYSQESDTVKCSELAHYVGPEIKTGEKPIAVMCGTTANGSKIIASGVHAEIVHVDVPREGDSASEKLSLDRNRRNHLETIYKTLGIIPLITSRL